MILWEGHGGLELSTYMDDPSDNACSTSTFWLMVKRIPWLLGINFKWGLEPTKPESKHHIIIIITARRDGSRHGGIKTGLCKTGGDEEQTNSL
jgi:hypothetical protein